MHFPTRKERNRKIGAVSNRATRWIGSTNSLIAHTIFFTVMIVLAFTRIGFDKIMLILTTIVSLEAIYLSIFIQMTVNKHTEDIAEVSEDIEEIQKDVQDLDKSKPILQDIKFK